MICLLFFAIICRKIKHYQAKTCIIPRNTPKKQSLDSSIILEKGERSKEIEKKSNVQDWIDLQELDIDIEPRAGEDIRAWHQLCKDKGTSPSELF